MDDLYEIDLPQNKCCYMGYSFNKDYQCVRTFDNNSYEIHDHNAKEIGDLNFTCPNKDYSIIYSFVGENSTTDMCTDIMLNGSQLFASCFEKQNNTNDGGITQIEMWGTPTYMPANIAHIILCKIIVTIYYFVPELSRSLYNRSVLRHYISLMCLGIMLCTLGYFEKCDCYISDFAVSCLWLILQYFTLSTVFWLNVICYDMTLVITRFECLRSTYEDNRKLLIYGILAWGSALLPVIFAAFFEFTPGVPKDFILKPKYSAYRDGCRRWVVNYYFFFLPTLTLLCNNVLFVYTTYKVIKINQSTEIATSNQTNNLKKNYMVFLRLYLLMGSPWFFGCLYAFVYNELIVLKVCRVLQPTLWIVILMSDKKLRRKFFEKIALMERRCEE